MRHFIGAITALALIASLSPNASLAQSDSDVISVLHNFSPNSTSTPSAPAFRGFDTGAIGLGESGVGEAGSPDYHPPGTMERFLNSFDRTLTTNPTEFRMVPTAVKGSRG